MKIKLLLIFVISFWLVKSDGFAQAYILSGQVSGGSETLPGVSVILYALPDTAIIMSFSITNSKGAFDLLIPDKENKYVLAFKYIGFSTAYISPSDTTEYVKVNLVETSFNIDEVLVLGRQSINSKKDTIIYNVASYSDSTEVHLSELLTKLPGIDVNNKGDILVYGQPAKRLLIDGADLAGRDYQVLTNNLRSNLVNKVEIIFNYLDNPLLSEVFSSENIAVNLILKDDKVRKINFDPILTFGQGSRYKVELAITAIYDKLKNISLAHTSEQLGDAFQYAGSVAKQSELFTDFSIVGDEEEYLNRPAFNYNEEIFKRFNQSSLISNKLQYNFGRSWKLNMTFDLPFEKQDQSVLNTYRFYDLESENFTDSLRIVKDMSQAMYKLRLSTSPSSNSLLNFYSAYSPIRRNYNFQAIPPEKNLTQDNDQQYFHQVDYTYRWNKKIVSIGTSYFGRYRSMRIFEISKRDRIFNSFLGIQYDTLAQRQKLLTDEVGISHKLLLRTKTMPLIIDIAYINSKRNYSQVLSSQFYRQLDSLNLQREEFKISLQHTCTVGRTTLNYFLHSGNLSLSTKYRQIGQLPSESKNYLYLGISMNKNYSSTRYLKINYLFMPFVPSFLQYGNFYSISNRNNLTRGNKMLSVNKTHNLSFDYRFNNTYPYLLVYTNLSFNFYKKYDLSSIYVENNISVNERVFKPYEVFSFDFYTGFEKYIPSLLSTLKIRPTYSQYSDIFILNDVQYKTHNYTLMPKFSLKSGWDFPVNVVLGVEYSADWITTKSTSQEGEKLFTSSRLIYMDFIAKLSPKVDVKYSNDFFGLLNSDGAYTSYSILNVEINCRNKNNRLWMKLFFHNILNISEIVTISKFDYFQRESTTIVQPRFMGLTIGYSL